MFVVVPRRSRSNMCCCCWCVGVVSVDVVRGVSGLVRCEVVVLSVRVSDSASGSVSVSVVFSVGASVSVSVRFSVCLFGW